jgi:hypothetical protein
LNLKGHTGRIIKNSKRMNKNIFNLFLILPFISILNAQNSISKPFDIKKLHTINFITGSVRNGIHVMEGISFKSKKTDSSILEFEYSITNWRDKFDDIEGEVKVNPASIVSDTFYMSNETDSLIPAYQFIDIKKKNSIMIYVSKNYEIASIFSRIKGVLYPINKNKRILSRK